MNDERAKRLAALSDAKQALLQERLRRGRSGNPAPVTIQQRPAEEITLLSFAQQRLWFLQQLEPDSPAYNIPTVFHLQGALNVPALIQTAREIARRHELLRSIFPVMNGQVVQTVDPTAHHSLTIPVIDLRSGAREARMAEAERLIATALRLPFHLAQEKPWRTSLLQLADEEYISLTITHHMLSDAWSTELFFREVSSLYAAFRSGHPSPFTEPHLQYADYAYWQRRRLQDGSLDTQIAYWKQQLAGPLPVLEFSTDFPRTRVPGYQGKRYPLHISRLLCESLHQFSRQEGVTPFITLLTAFKVLLYHYTMQEDLLVGTPIAGRTRPEFEMLPGCFLNTLVLRTDLSGNPDFRELLQRVRRIVLDAFDHQDVPFEKLVEDLQTERDLSRHPLFQVMFVLQNVPLVAYDLPGIVCEQMMVTTDTAKFDMEWCLHETEHGLNGYIEYNTDLFEAETIERLQDTFGRILAYVLAHPDQPIGAIPLVSYTEWQSQGTISTPTPTHDDPHHCLHTLFELQAKRTPDVIAISSEQEQLTYHELNLRANQLAHLLLTLGVRPGTHIGICIEHSPDLIIGLLAILKSGAAYVALDPIYTKERLAYMAEDAKVTLLLTLHNYRTNLPIEQIPTIYLDDDAATIFRQSTTNPCIAITDTYLAYIIYTSGSTGRTKGVMIPHAHVVHLFMATQHLYHFNASDVWTLFHSYAFDVSVWEIWGAFLHGGRLVIVPYWTTRSPVDFYALLYKEQITILNQTPMAFYQLQHVEDIAAYQKRLALRLIIFAGEALDTLRLLPWLERHGDQNPQLVNMYGLTEVTIHATYRFIHHKDKELPGSRIGHPLPGLHLYVLNRHLQPVPIGASGELYIGGTRLAIGYANNPALTTERFVKHLFSTIPGMRLYKTGDIVRCLANGDLEYVGRNDHQIKLRGYRIEPGEIEAILDKHPVIRESVIVVQEFSSSDKRLIAYVVPQQGRTPAARELRGFLQERLPHYMIPATFILLEALPLTSNGKLDRNALPPANVSVSSYETPCVLAQTPTEEKLAAIWCRLLQIEQISMDDDFFELGGHSLLAVQVVSHIREHFHIEMPVWTIFKTPTVRALATTLEQFQTEQRIDHTSSIVPIPRELYRRKQLSDDGMNFEHWQPEG